MIGTIIEWGASLFDCALCVYFITIFNRSTFRKNLFILPTLIVLYGFTLFSDNFLPGFSVLTIIIVWIIATLYALIISNKDYISSLVSSSVFYICYTLISSLLFSVLSFFIDDFDLLLQGSNATVRYIQLFLHKVALFAILKLMLFVFKADKSIGLKNGILTFLFSLITLLGLGGSMRLATLPHAIEMETPILIITSAFIATNVVLYILLAQVQKLQQSKYKLMLLEEKTRFEEARFNDAKTIWKNVRMIQHDMKQHLTVISGHLNENEIDKCKEYLNNLLPTVEQTGTLIKSENKVLDYIINSKLYTLKETQVIISGSIGSLSDIEDSDLACLMGNILDNAIDAIANLKEKRIELLFYRENSNRIIVCKNTVAQSVLKNNRELKSTKKGDSHGFGHKIVAKIVDKYHGIIDYFEDFDMFCVMIILPTLRNRD